MAAIDKSLYELLTIESNDQSKSVDIRTGTVSIDYYEDIFSPTVTAKIRVVNTGDSIPSSSGGGFQSIYNGLPLRGGERVALKIKKNSEGNAGLDFSKNVKDYFYVSSITEVISETQRESFVLNLVSREAITNETSRVLKKYSTASTIDTSVRDILKEYLKTEKVGTIDRTTNKYGFIGNMRKPFTVLVWLASKAVPSASGDSSAGFLFFQTKEGFQFRSIDELIKQTSKAEYYYTQVNENKINRNNDFKILKYFTDKNQNLLEKLRLGTYSSYRMFYDPLKFTFTSPSEGKFTLNNYSSGVKNLGQSLKLPNISSSNSTSLGESPTRIITQVMDVGTLDPTVSKQVNADPGKYQSQALMRYNILFTQSVNMTVALNTNLNAGDIITCKFPKISNSDKDEYDEEQSGLYMIKELCHHFDGEASYTSMKLIRDTFGLHGTNNK
jgi:hypothetical protein